MRQSAIAQNAQLRFVVHYFVLLFAGILQWLCCNCALSGIILCYCLQLQNATKRNCAKCVVVQLRKMR